MKKLYFHYGTVSSSKSLQLLYCAHNYSEQNKKAVLIKPKMDTRSVGISSRAGVAKPANIVLGSEDSLTSYYAELDGASVVLVDEVQFLTSKQILELRQLTLGKLGDRKINPTPVLTYGLRTTSDGVLWDSIKTLLAVADEIKEIKTVCVYCDHKAVFSKAVQQTNSVINISWDGYIPVCPYHYYNDSV